MFALEIIPITSSILTESLTYFSKEPVSPGTIVTVPLRNKNITGILLSSNNVRDIKQNLRHQNFKIKHISKIHDKELFSPAYLGAILLLKNYYLVHTGKLIDITYPKMILKNIPEFTHTKNINKKNTTYKERLLQESYQNRIKKYIALSKKNKEKNKSLHIVCPTIQHAKKIHKDLEKTNLKNVHILHGKTSKKKLMETYEASLKEPSILISTAIFIDFSLLNKSHIILEKDSSSYYYRAIAPIIDLRLLVQEYAKQSNIEIIFADNLLRPIRFKDKYIPKKELFSNEKIKIIDVNKKQIKKKTDRERIEELGEGKIFSPISKEIITSIRKSLEKNQKIFCYVQKKSLAPILSCKTCGNIAMDTKSKKPYSLYIKKNNETGEKERIFINPKTGEQIPAFDLCNYCHTGTLELFGIGTNTVAEKLNGEFPNTNILICDSFHIKNETSLKNLFKKFNNRDQKTILIGTQKAIPYIENIDNSYIISIDGMFSQMSYTTDFRALYIIKNIEEQTKNKLYIQSRNTLVNNLPILKDNDIKKFIEERLSEAKSFSIHPYGTLLKITHTCKVSNYRKITELYSNRLKSWNPHMQIKPASKKNMVTLEVLLQLAKNTWELYIQNQELSKNLPLGEHNINIEINPEVF